MPHRTLSRGSALLLATATLLFAACTSDDATPTPSATPPPEVTSTAEATPTSPATPTATPTQPPRELTFAPNGRTGLPDLDTLIDVLVSADAAAINAAVGPIDAQIPTCSPGSESTPMIRIPVEEWTATLAAADRALYAVTRRSEITEALEVRISLGTGDLEQRWRFTVSRADVIEIRIPCDPPGFGVGLEVASDFLVAPPLVTADVGQPGAPPTLDADGWPAEVEGPLVVYSYRVREERDPQFPTITWPVIAVVTYDAGAGRELGRFELDERTRTAAVLGLSGSDVLIDRDRAPRGSTLSTPSPPVAPDHGVFAYSLAGEELRLVTDVFAGTEFAPLLAPDGVTLAGSSAAGTACQPFIRCTAFAPVLDGAEPLVWPNPGIELEPEAWRDDRQSVLSWHVTHSEGPSRIYEVTRDGDVSEVGPASTVAPGGRHMAHATEPRLPWIADAFGCDIYDAVTIDDVDAAAPIATVQLPGVSIAGQSRIQWSPDGRSLLIVGHDTPPDTTEGCLAAASRWRQTPERAFRHDLDTGVTTPVADPNAPRAEWSSAPVIATRCLGVDTVSLQRASGRWQIDHCADQNLHQRYSTLLIDGAEVAVLTTLRGVTITIADPSEG